MVLSRQRQTEIGQPIDKHHFDADNALEVQRSAEDTAAYGASLAKKVGLSPRSMAVEAAPTWKGIVKVAEEQGAGLIVIGSHRHSGLVGHLVGSVAAAVIAHSTSCIFVVHHGS